MASGFKPRRRTPPFSFFMSPWHLRQYVWLDIGSSAYLRWNSVMLFTLRHRGQALRGSPDASVICDRQRHAWSCTTVS